MRPFDEIFDEAGGFHGDERRRYLDRECGGDAGLRREVEALLASDEAAAAQGFWNGTALDALAKDGVAAAPAGERVFGPYRTIELIGAGGMGLVYRAVRDDGQFSRDVAIKVLKRGMDSDAILRRFRRERQILAGLEHPNIARLLDAGLADGVPYLVMEYVPGRPLNAHVADPELPVPERLRLFRKICSAVHAAHGKLVLHRDLKPANILVTADGEPKLLDFGIAALLSAGDAETQLTLAGPVMTERYASPEQIAGLPLATTSDVYSLGAILFELLANAPFERGREWSPSDANPRWRTLLRGDLDAIVGLALRPEPEQRYQSVEQLAADIGHHLGGRPVLARKGGLRYRGGRFVARNRIPLAAAAAMAVVLCAGAASTLREKRRAERQLGRERMMAHSMLIDLQNRVAQLPGSIAVRRYMVEQARNTLDQIAREEADDASIQQDLAAANLALGDVQGKPYSANLGDSQGALESYRNAQRGLEAALRNRPGDPAIVETLIRADTSLELLLLRLGRSEEALGAARKAAELAARLGSAGGRPARIAAVSAQRNLAVALFNIEAPAAMAASTREALAQIRSAVAASEKLVGEARDPQGVAELAQDYAYLGYILWKFAALEGGAASYGEALAAHRRRLALLAGSGGARTVADAHSDVGRSLAHCRRLEEALAEFAQALPILEGLAARDPADAEAQHDLADLHRNVAETYLLAGGYAKARTEIARATGLYDGLVARDADAADTQAYANLSRKIAGEIERAENGREDEEAPLGKSADYYRVVEKNVRLR